MTVLMVEIVLLVTGQVVVYVVMVSVVVLPPEHFLHGTVSVLVSVVFVTVDDVTGQLAFCKLLYSSTVNNIDLRCCVRGSNLSAG